MPVVAFVTPSERDSPPSLCSRVPQRSERHRLHRRPKRLGRIPLARGPIRSCALPPKVTRRSCRQCRDTTFDAGLRRVSSSLLSAISTVKSRRNSSRNLTPRSIRPKELDGIERWRIASRQAFLFSSPLQSEPFARPLLPLAEAPIPNGPWDGSCRSRPPSSWRLRLRCAYRRR